MGSLAITLAGKRVGLSSVARDPRRVLLWRRRLCIWRGNCSSGESRPKSRPEYCRFSGHSLSSDPVSLPARRLHLILPSYGHRGSPSILADDNKQAIADVPLKKRRPEGAAAVSNMLFSYWAVRRRRRRPRPASPAPSKASDAGSGAAAGLRFIVRFALPVPVAVIMYSSTAV